MITSFKLFESLNSDQNINEFLKSIENIGLNNKKYIICSLSKEDVNAILDYISIHRNTAFINILKERKDLIEILDPKYYNLFDNLFIQKLELEYKKSKRTKQEIKYDKENDFYIFIGYKKYDPININDKSEGFRDKLVIERLIKIDKYDIKTMQTIKGMKIRDQFQYGNFKPDEHGVYLVITKKGLFNDINLDDVNKLDYVLDSIDERKIKI